MDTVFLPHAQSTANERATLRGNTMDQKLPSILSSYGAFRQHLEGQLKGLSGHAKGDPWQEFAKRLVPLTDFGKPFGALRNNPKKTRDKGWDIFGKDEDTKSTIYVQAKYSVPDINELESVISSWVPLAGVVEGQLPFDELGGGNANVYFALVTLSDLHSAILPRYRESRRPAVTYFDMWIAEKRVVIIDGPVIYLDFRQTKRAVCDLQRPPLDRKLGVCQTPTLSKNSLTN